MVGVQVLLHEATLRLMTGDSVGTCTSNVGDSVGSSTSDSVGMCTSNVGDSVGASTSGNVVVGVQVLLHEATLRLMTGDSVGTCTSNVGDSVGLVLVTVWGRVLAM